MSEKVIPVQEPDHAARRHQASGGRERNHAKGQSVPGADPSGDAAGMLYESSRPDSCRDFMEQMPFAVLIVRTDFTVDYLNGRFREMFGYEIQDIPDVRSWFDCFVHKPISHDMIDQFFDTRTPRTAGMHWETVIAVRTRQCGRRLCRVHFVALADGRLLTIYENFAERSRIESDMHYTRIDSVGILSSGLDLVMNGIVEGLQRLLERQQGQEPSVVRQIQGIEQEARSGRELLHRIQNFAGVPVKGAKPVDLNEILRKTSTVFANTRGGITVRRKLKDELWAVTVDRIQLEKMLIHLYIDLQQRSPDSGELHIDTDNACLFGPESTLYKVKPGRYVKVTLSAGATTQGQAGRPRALRLSSLMSDTDPLDNMSITYAQCIVQGHDGVMMVSDAGGGVPVIQLFLPACGAKTAPASARRDVSPSGGMILLVDDDAILIEVIREILETAGYRVLKACNGREALEIYEAWRGDIDLVMLDMIMPVMGGAEAFGELKKIDPDVPVIIISGYSLRDEVNELLAQGCKGFLQKPFLIPEMFKEIRRVTRRDEGKRE
jgi:CheY-like chemotaxis protein/PAS domain-containing protein